MAYSEFTLLLNRNNKLIKYFKEECFQLLRNSMRLIDTFTSHTWERGEWKHLLVKRVLDLKSKDTASNTLVCQVYKLQQDMVTSLILIY